MNSKKFSPYAPVILRLALAAVYFWFGTSQIINPASWTGFVPSWVTGFSGMSALTVVHLNGWFEIAGGILLAFGIFVQPVAFFLFFHLLIIASGIGLSPIGVRDFGLGFATLAVALFGADGYCLYPKENEPLA